MASQQRHVFDARKRPVSGEFVDIDGERFYAIRNVDEMPPFFVSVVSHGNHWLFASSTGALTAGRVSPETALFPYVTVDKIHDSREHTGPITLVRAQRSNRTHLWTPFAAVRDHDASVSRSIFKNTLGNKLRFEEIHHDLELAFRYTWSFSDRHGFVRQCELENLATRKLSVELIDGLQNVLPAGTPRFAQTNTSNLVDAYKWSERDADTGLACFTLYSGITDRAEPFESLRATTVYSLGLEDATVMLASDQLEDFRRGATPHGEALTRGKRGAYLSHVALELGAAECRRWLTVADIEQDQADVVALRAQLRTPTTLARAIADDIAAGDDALARIMASSDAFQATNEENVSEHHYANVLFNVLRGGIFDHHYDVTLRNFRRSLRAFDRKLAARHADWLNQLPATLPFTELLPQVEARGDAQLTRLTQEYLPIRFGRRHGDPSRPWNQFAIELEDEHGERILAYQGNWRDIFQNWEALSLSYPEFVENMIAKFVNATTLDGYNPYRITDEGIDWEVEEPDDPWSYIGYWGDHQIIYLQKLLEWSHRFHPQRLGAMLARATFCYANVPYRIRPFEALLKDPKNTVDFDEAVAAKIDREVAARGADGKLVLAADGDVYLVTLLEKLLVPLLSKLGNLVVDGGIWLNTQRPEWNDANNALVGQGLSMVTLYYMRRYVTFFDALLEDADESCELTEAVRDWLRATADGLASLTAVLDAERTSPAARHAALSALGRAASNYRQRVFADVAPTAKTTESVATIRALLADALRAIDHSIANNKRDDGLYHAYNILGIDDDALRVDTLYPMLEGQVAALSSGAIGADEAADVIEALFDSDVYRADQNSFMLYPDRKLPGYLQRNCFDADDVAAIELVQKMLAGDDHRLVVRDIEGNHRFHADLCNARKLDERLDTLQSDYGAEVDAARQPLHALYESVFNHRAFTGRSGTMFGFEGLGCIYWHMVSKFLLAAQENYFAAVASDAGEATCRRLGALYYRIRAGIGFNKSPDQYGAFPTDPYSHTPRHAGARQPGMTGQVKEEILTRFGELGVHISGGGVTFAPTLLRAQEFLKAPASFRYLDVADTWQTIEVPADALAFSWCQVPLVYRLGDAAGITVVAEDGAETSIDGLRLPPASSNEIFSRSGRVRQLTVTFPRTMLFTAS